jgi:hypothetical protein
MVQRRHWLDSLHYCMIGWRCRDVTDWIVCTIVWLDDGAETSCTDWIVCTIVWLDDGAETSCTDWIVCTIVWRCRDVTDWIVCAKSYSNPVLTNLLFSDATRATDCTVWEIYNLIAPIITNHIALQNKWRAHWCQKCYRYRECLRGRSQVCTLQ